MEKLWCWYVESLSFQVLSTKSWFLLYQIWKPNSFIDLEVLHVAEGYRFPYI